MNGTNFFVVPSVIRRKAAWASARLGSVISSP
jgi:hypothetical protein